VSGGKADLPALGFGMGDVVLAELLKARGLLPRFTAGLRAYVLIEDESLRADSLAAVQRLRDSGLAIEFAMTPAKSDKQFKRAIELDAANTVRLERAPDGVLTARIKNLTSRTETVVPVGALTERLQAAGP
jgi:histidyl-tRNA synthetase